MKCFRCLFVFAAIFGAVALLHDDADARPSGPVTVATTAPTGAVQPAPLPTVALAAAPATSSYETRTDRGFLGVGVTTMSDQLRETFEVPAGVGVLVDEVEADSPAERSGLRAGDVIVSFDGEEVASASQLARRIRDAGADTTVALGFYRKGRFRQEPVTLAGRSDDWAASIGDFGDSTRADWTDEEWEEWGERFGEQMAERFEAMGEEWEARGEAWAEHGEEWGERWAEWGEQFGERWAEWGEQFGERMAEWGEQFGARFEDLGERFGERFEEGDLSREEWEQVGEEIERALEAVDWEEIGAEIERSMDEVDWEQLNADLELSVQESLARVDWEDVNLRINTAIRSALESLEHAGVLVERSQR